MRQHLLILLLVGSLSVSAQDYFEDLRGNGNPISINVNKTFNISARLNIGDNSAKANFFKIWRLKEEYINRDTWIDSNFADSTLNKIQFISNLGKEEDFSESINFSPGVSSFRLTDLGLGSSMKGKIKEGLGTLFTKGGFTGESQLGIYGVWHRIKIMKDEHKHTIVISPFLNVNHSAYRLIPDSSMSFATLDTTLGQLSYGVSFFRKSYINEKSQLILGFSLTKSRPNNWDDLDKAELKEVVVRNEPPFTNALTTVEDKGYIYGLGMIDDYTNLNLRPHITYIPFALEYRVGLIFYPSIDFAKKYAEPLKNIGLGIHFLEKGNPTISNLGIFFELNDVTNAKEKTDPFLKRSFKVGLTTALNVTSLIKK